MYHCSFEPYTGSEKYIFISYAHKDAEEVYPILDALAGMGFRVWYDESVASDAEWTEFIAERLENCWAVLAFLSPEFVKSENCKNEIFYALEEKRASLILAELCPTELPSELKMPLIRKQRTKKYDFETQEAFLQKLCSSEKIRDCLAGETEATVSCSHVLAVASRAKQTAELSAIDKSTLKYKDKWFEPMFLNNFDDEFADAQGTTISLNDLYHGTENYLLPSADYKGRKDPLTPEQLKKRLTTSLKKGIMILGAPGIGKSTLITWFCNAYPAIVCDCRIIRVYSLKDILHKDEIDEQHPEQAVLQGVGIREVDLENSILILDGLDETSVKEKEAFVNRLFQHWNAVENFSLIITCRINYVNLKKLDNAYAVLQPWNKTEIRTFAGYYHKASGEKIHEESLPVMCQKQKIFGIPLITYMVLASKISVATTDDETEIYDKLFALDGGIMDRAFEKNRYEKSSAELDKEKILDLSRKMAFWMFENNPEQADIPDVFRKFPELEENGSLADFYKQVHITDGEAHLEFVHRTFYEYFTADYLCTELIKIMPGKGQPFQMGSPAPLAGVLAHFCKKGAIETGAPEGSQIAEFVQAKLKKAFAKHGPFDADGDLTENAYFWFEEGVVELFNSGMTYYAYLKDEQQERSHPLVGEMTCANNVLWLLSAVYAYYRQGNTKNGEQKIRMFAHSSSGGGSWKARDSYLRTASVYEWSKFRLQYADLHEADLRGTNLLRTDLGSANLHGANLRGANLSEANLSEADLHGAILRVVDLRLADLRGANLLKTDLGSANLSGADLRYADLRDANLGSADLHLADLRYADLRDADMSHAYLNTAHLTSIHHTNMDIGENFPNKSIGWAQFNTIYVDDKKYSRKEFFATFQPRTDHLG